MLTNMKIIQTVQHC